MIRTWLLSNTFILALLSGSAAVSSTTPASFEHWVFLRSALVNWADRYEVPFSPDPAAGNSGLVSGFTCWVLPKIAQKELHLCNRILQKAEQGGFSSFMVAYAKSVQFNLSASEIGRLKSSMDEMSNSEDRLSLIKLLPLVQLTYCNMIDNSVLLMDPCPMPCSIVDLIRFTALNAEKAIKGQENCFIYLYKISQHLRAKIILQKCLDIPMPAMVKTETLDNLIQSEEVEGVLDVDYFISRMVAEPDFALVSPGNAEELTLAAAQEALCESINDKLMKLLLPSTQTKGFEEFILDKVTTLAGIEPAERELLRDRLASSKYHIPHGLEMRQDLIKSLPTAMFVRDAMQDLGMTAPNIMTDLLTSMTFINSQILYDLLCSLRYNEKLRSLLDVEIIPLAEDSPAHTEELE